MCEVYGMTPEQLGNLTVSQFYMFRDYAYRSRVEDLLGEHNFGEKSNWSLPGIKGERKKKLSDFDIKIQAIKKRTGKTVLTSEDLKGIL